MSASAMDDDEDDVVCIGTCLEDLSEGGSCFLLRSNTYMRRVNTRTYVGPYLGYLLHCRTCKLCL